jgi:hypothetical protein
MNQLLHPPLMDVERAVKDAERYQHLRNKSADLPAHGLDVAFWEDGGGTAMRGEELDARVDTEMANAMIRASKAVKP